MPLPPSPCSPAAFRSAPSQAPAAVRISFLSSFVLVFSYSHSFLFFQLFIFIRWFTVPYIGIQFPVKQEMCIYARKHQQQKNHCHCLTDCDIDCTDDSSYHPDDHNPVNTVL